jgi:hypothetical protein
LSVDRSDIGVKVWRVGPLNDSSGLRVGIDQSTDLARAEREIRSRMKLGDRIVALAPDHPTGVVTSERGTVTEVDDHGLTARMDHGRHVRLRGHALGPDRLDHAYAMTVHRTQGDTADACHVFGDGGGRELAYVATSRARGPSYSYVVADDVSQAAEDLRREWASERRQRWVLDTDEPAPDGTRRQPHLAPPAEQGLRAARLRAEQAALLTVLGPTAIDSVGDARRRATSIRAELEDLRAGDGRYADTAVGIVARRLREAERSHTTRPGAPRPRLTSPVAAATAITVLLRGGPRSWPTLGGSGPASRYRRSAASSWRSPMQRASCPVSTSTERVRLSTEPRVSASTPGSQRSTVSWLNSIPGSRLALPSYRA